jgi:hypothetical protein
MSEKNSNRISILIAVAAIFLILGGVFLLNRSFSSSNLGSSSANNSKSASKTTPNAKPNSTTAQAPVSPAASNSNGATITPPAPKADPNTTTPGANPVATASASSPSTAASTTAPSTPLVSSIPTTIPEKQIPTTPKPLTKNEILAVYKGISPSSGLPLFEIQDCGNIGSRLCVAPNKFSINNARYFDVNLKENSKYKFVATYGEDASYIIFDTVSSIEEVK